MKSVSRIELRSITASDKEDIFLGLSNPEVIKYYGVCFETLEATEEQMIWFQDLEKNGTGKWWSIFNSKTGQFLGAAGFNDLNKKFKKAEIGFWLLPEFWSRGYMQESMPLICDYGFNELGLNRIEGIVESENLNCKRAIEKLGFTLESTSRDNELKKGKLLSLDTYIKLKM
ncbi:GNAT family N-acetyltransferase [Gillisia sp. CAL575]|uniref:GNAT family N-acetyltransferase n=1 Tax=Gillisia sp. CAL575 TaxID=985255 RepID=UPI00039E677B|nr:GNAT family N-acetyltransferase [Gillisia sp. CAL575]